MAGFTFTLDLLDNLSPKLRTITVASKEQADALNELSQWVKTADIEMKDYGNSVESIAFKMKQLSKVAEALPASAAGTRQELLRQIDVMGNYRDKLNGLVGEKGSISELRRELQRLQKERNMIGPDKMEELKKYNDRIKEITENLKKMEQATNSAADATDDLGDSADKASSDSKGGFGAFSKKLLKIGIAVAAVKKAYDGFQSVMEVGANNEMMKANLLTLTRGDVAQRDDLFRQVTDYGQKTVYDKAGLLGNMQTMMGYGMTGNDSMETLKKLGDISMGDTTKMSRLAANVAQAYSTGHVTGVEERQFATQGFNLRKILEEGGDTAAATRKTLTYEDLQKAMSIATSEGGKFYNGAEAAGETMAGRKMQFSDAKDELLNKIYEVVQPLAADVLGWASDIISMLSDTVVPLIQPLADMVAPLLQTLMSTLTPIIGPLLESVIALITPIFELLTAALPPLLDAVISILMPLLNMLVPVIQAICDAIITILPPLFGLIEAILPPIMSILQLVLDLVKPILDILVAVLNPILNLLTFILQPILECLNMILAPVLTILNQLLTFFAPIINVLAKLMEIIFKMALTPLLLLMKGVSWVVNKVMTFVSKVVGVIIDIYNAIVGFFGGQKQSKAGLETSGAPSGEDPSMGVTPTIPNAPSASPALAGAVNGGASAAASGGTRSTSINITIGDMIKECNFVGAATENQAEIERVFAEAFNRVLGIASASAGVAV